MQQQHGSYTGAILARKAMDEARPFTLGQDAQVAAEHVDHRRVARHAGIDRHHALAGEFGGRGLCIHVHMRRAGAGLAVVGDDFAIETFDAPAWIAFTLARAAQVDDRADVQLRNRLQVAIARIDVLARAPQQPGLHPSAVRRLPSAIVAEVVDAIGVEEGFANHPGRCGSHGRGPQCAASGKHLGSRQG